MATKVTKKKAVAKKPIELHGACSDPNEARVSLCPGVLTPLPQHP